MAGELSNAMADAVGQAMALNTMTLEYIADAFATPEQRDFFQATLPEVMQTFDSHGHGKDLRYCQDPFCVRARETIQGIVGQQIQGIQGALANPQGGM
jgi:hypothetical protein|tara:strand:- start:92 stop:385 length:294 start_codon:yes stop_codon:yes gene_type:complete